MTQVRTTQAVFQYAAWWRADGKPLGKVYELDERNELVGTTGLMFANRVERRTIRNLAELKHTIEMLQPGQEFITSGLPPEGVTAVTVKDEPKSGHVARTSDDVRWLPGVGGIFLNDFDAKWCPWFSAGDEVEPLDELLPRLQRAATMGGLDLSDTQALTYLSSSSSLVVREDNTLEDNLGRHILFLVQDQSDLGRFRDALAIFLTLTDSMYGAVSNAGTFLHRGIMDVTAIQPQQPTFVAPPVHGPGLTTYRELKVRDGAQTHIDTRGLRDPTDHEIRQYEAFWAQEEIRLERELQVRRGAWLNSCVDELECQRTAAGLPALPHRTLVRIVKGRLGGNLRCADFVVLDNFGAVSVREILENPERYDEATGADPIEPDYGGGNNVAKVYLNQDTGHPQIFSQAHGGLLYRLWFDHGAAVAYLAGVSESECLQRTDYVLSATAVDDQMQVDVLLAEVAKQVHGVTKKTIQDKFRPALLATVVQKTDLAEGASRNRFKNSEEPIDDTAYQAAKALIADTPIECVEGDLWRWTGTHWNRLSQHAAEQLAQAALKRNGWTRKKGSLTRRAVETVRALKQLTFRMDSPIAQEPDAIMNLQNGELLFDEHGNAVLRPHNPVSGMTYVLNFPYDESATAPAFMKAVHDMFLPGWRQWSGTDARARKRARSQADEMRDHLLEQMAYIVVPKRWITEWLFWKGGGSNGKTLLSDVLLKLLPKNAIESDDLLKLADSFGVARTRGKSLLLDDDLATNVTLPDAFLKKFSEPKFVSADVKHAPESISFWNRAVVLLLANNWPRVVDTSHGFVRRIHATPFDREFLSREKLESLPVSEREAAKRDLADPHLLGRIECELPGVVNELVRAYGRLRARDGYHWPSPVKRAGDDLLSYGNPLQRFIDESCATGHMGKHIYKRSEFHAHLKAWLATEDVNWQPSAQQIGIQMGQLGFTTKTIDGVRYYSGLMPGAGRPPLRIIDGGLPPDDGGGDE